MSPLGSAEFQTAEGKPILPGEIAEGTARIGTLSGRPTLIIRKNGQLLAYDALCTHLGCIVKWDAQESSIECPCHGGVFASNGKVVAGPPPKNLLPVSLKVDGQRIYRT